MKKLSLIIAVGLGLSACADKDSDFARKHKGPNKSPTAQGTLDKKAAGEASKAQLLCENPAKIVCEIKVTPVTTSIKKEGFERSVALLQKKYHLGEKFSGQPEDFKDIEESLRNSIQHELLVNADQEYRTIHDYNADLLEAGEIVREISLKNIAAKELNADDKLKMNGVVNLVVFQTLQEAFKTEYLNSSAVREQIFKTCGHNGLSSEIYSSASENSPNHIMGACPGFLLESAGKSKDERIARLVFALSQEIAAKVKTESLTVETQKTLTCLQSQEKISITDLENDIWATEILQAHLATVEDKASAAAEALNGLCKSGTEEDKARLLKILKIEKLTDQLGCEKAARC